MKKNSPVQTLVKTNFTMVEAGADIQTIRFIFNHFPNRFLPVVRSMKFVGVILREDFLRKFVASDDYLLSAKDLISKEMVKLSPTNTLAEAKEIFDANVYNVLPIADDEGDLVGVLLREDVEQNYLVMPTPFRERFTQLRQVAAAAMY